ncbi:Splicing factor [Seminavis robusta]|uniref:Splicing factor n=1 Tax=Seminavis robusta TaxID=568900 RepID=A0A9N8HH44_9STRA|nr:Splicing factor [Seminavis robusta]|eukprot:Sro614_g175720.1 Splicing factor (544) ;mRNA; r:26521-28360
MGISAAERNRRKRQRKKKKVEAEEEEQKANDAVETKGDNADDSVTLDVEIEYVVEKVVVPTAAADNKSSEEEGAVSSSLEEIESVLRKFEERSNFVTDDDDEDAKQEEKKDEEEDYDDEDDEENEDSMSKRKLREMIRPSLAELKRRVTRPDLVEAHDVTAYDPEFLIELKGAPGTVPVPRHWGRKRKYLQGKRGFEKTPFQLPDFIIKTGIAEVRDSLNETEAGQSAKQKNRGRVAPKMGAIDIDYRTLHSAFFKHQSKPANLTKIGDTYYEGKELETNTNIKPGGQLSDALRTALGMTDDHSPPPWLNNMQRYGPPPSYPQLKIPGLNAQLPHDQCQYGYHPGGWGKPPVDPYGRPLYGGNPFDPPGNRNSDAANDALLVTSHGKTLAKVSWGALPEAGFEEAEESDVEESSDEEMDESESEEEDGEVADPSATESVVPPSVLPPGIQSSAPPLDLRKQPGDITPMVAAPKQLYQVLPQQQPQAAAAQAGTVFASSNAYVLPNANNQPADGMASVLSKGVQNDKAKKKNDDKEDTGKAFKF